MTNTPRPRISAVVNTLNEERRLPHALGSVRPWVDEIVVVDMHSDDNTADIARGFGAVVYLHERVGYADPARAFAVDQSTGDWILVLDADEMVPAPLARRLMEIARGEAADIVRIPMLNYLFGAPLRGTGWGREQDTHMRFFRRGSMEITGDIHDYLHPAAGARIIEIEAREGLCLVHHNYSDVAHFVEKLNRYTEIEADAISRQKGRTSRSMALAGAAREFARRYVKQRGFRDGWRGFYLAWLMAGYRLITAAKVAQLRTAGTRDEIEAEYRRTAQRLLGEYATFDDNPGQILEGHGGKS